VLATKFGKPMGDGAERRGSKRYIRQAIEASLRRLQTDHVELYQHHEEDPSTPLEETLATVRELVDEGKVLSFGSSNYAPDTLDRAAAIAHELGVPFVSEQSEYSWLARDAELDLIPACDRLGLAFIPYFPLASGLLTGKVSSDRPPAEGTRLYGRAIDDDELARVESLSAWAVSHGASLLEVAVGGLLGHSTVVSVIAGATKPEQVTANAAAGAWRPSPAEFDELLASRR
jgi:aryl-alcohol dehydrogenase-like predicted oxidoreductase